MALGKLTDPDAVERAIAEFDELGRDAFLEKYGFAPARSYVVVKNGREYDSKAIVGAAYGFQHPEQGPLRAAQFVGGDATVKARLTKLGFRVRRKAVEIQVPPLEKGRVYTWEELGELFQFKPNYLGSAGGMVPSPATGALLLITHPGGGRSFDYGDYWDGRVLVYAGRGQHGDQELSGANRQAADNARALLVFEAAEPRRLRFLGRATCESHYWATGPDSDRADRRIIRLRLGFMDEGGRGYSTSTTRPPRDATTQRLREPRIFDPSREPGAVSPGVSASSPEERAQLLEKANRNHFKTLRRLHGVLGAGGWAEVQEIPGGVDLWGIGPEGRVIFEVKSIADGNEIAQTRSAVSQLLEYRFFYGNETDKLCLVTDRPISDARIRFLESMGIGAVWFEGEAIQASGEVCRGMMGAVFTETDSMPQGGS